MLKRHLIKFSFLSLFFLGLHSKAQTINVEIPWQTDASTLMEASINKSILYFNGATYDNDFIPHYYYQINNPANKSLASVNIKNIEFASLSEDERAINVSKLKSVIAEWTEGIAQHVRQTDITIPVVLENRKVKNFELEFIWKDNPLKKVATLNFPTQSKLSQGDWYKIITTKKGIHKITGTQLKNAIPSLSTISSNTIRVVGQNNGMLPEMNNIDRPLELLENAIQVVDGGDGVLDNNDYILFYAAGPDKWAYNNTKKALIYEKNIYTDEANYFISFNSGNGKRVTNAPTFGSTSPFISSSYDEYWVHELEKSNLDRTGREWYGEKFDVTSSYSFNIPAPNRITSDSVYFEFNNVANSSIASRFNLTNNGSTLLTQHIGKLTAVSGYFPKAMSSTAPYKKEILSGNNMLINVEFENLGNFNAFGYLDYLMVNYRNALTFNNNQLHFRDIKAWKSANDVVKFNYTSTNSDLNIWDITENSDAKNIISSGNAFHASAEELREFIAFNPNNTFSVDAITPVNNQNLHSILQADYVLIYHKDFKESALELKSFHENYSNYDVAFVSTEEIYNEFSSGRNDLTAIKDFLRMIYFRMETQGKKPTAVTLFGDASYDFKNYSNDFSCYIPTWEDPRSLSINQSTATDDYLVCLDDNEGSPLRISDKIDIGIGRFVINSNQQGLDMVNKIKAYKNRDNYGPWQKQISIVADDVDEQWERSALGKSANAILDNFNNEHINYSINKIFSDAYEQVNSSGGQRYPEVEKAINNAVVDGSLVVHYFGHGGEAGWATERILSVDDINGWSNMENLTSFITTTCEFTRYDDRERVSAGEYAHLNPKGGAISLFTTTRTIYANEATRLSDQFYKVLNSKNSDGEHFTMGELALKVKHGSNLVNKRRFILVGDPGLKLNYPEQNIVFTKINNQDFGNQTDTLKALEKITIEGEVQTLGHVLNTGFNGTAFLEIFDKKKLNETLNNDNVPFTPTEAPFVFYTQSNKIFKGEADVVNGQFKFEFIVPKDIDLTIGKAKVSAFAKSNTTDAWGADTTLYSGGIISNPSEDNMGPDIDLFMNDITFVTGGLTDDNPDIYAILKDSNGINAVGTGVGHDIIAILDAKSSNPIVLNDFYKTFPNSFTRGEVRYNLTDVADGEHTLSLRAWDNYNNSNTEEITFVVARNPKVALNHVLNFPNPFTSSTDFQFEHNYENQTIEAQVQIFSISGRLVKTLTAEIQNAQSRVNGKLIWDGLDDFGNTIGKGVYIYKLTIQIPETGKRADKTEKLVIIK
ncbi:MAG: type IX secretion system sortase PorU [Flavobacteriales bacterium]